MHGLTPSHLRFSVWDGWELIEEYDEFNVRQTAYLQGATGVIKSLLDNIYYYQDKLGSTTHVANASGALVESYRYDLYGTPKYFDSTSQPLNSSTYNIVDLYAGERWVGELGLYDLRNRFMSPELGRFLQADPIGFKGDASNLYRYCGNDSVNRLDPLGLLSSLTITGGGDWIADSRGISYREAELISNARIQDDINNFERRMNVDRPGGASVKWTGKYQEIHGDPNHQFKEGQVAVSEWSVNSTASAEGGKISRFNNELKVTVQWNDSASKYSQYRAKLNRGGEIEHFRDALRAGSYADGHGHRRFSSARDIADRTSRDIIGREMPLEAAQTKMEAPLRDWAALSMADSRLEWDVWGKHIFVDR